MSSLGDRLAALRGSPAAASRPADELLERLQKLGVRGRVRGRERAFDSAQLAALLQARPLAQGVLQIERRMKIPGDWDLPAELPGQTALAHANLLFFDTETIVTDRHAFSNRPENQEINGTSPASQAFERVQESRVGNVHDGGS